MLTNIPSLRNFKPTIVLIVGLLSFLFMGVTSLNAATITTTGSGNWNSTVANAPWPGGTVPAVGDNVIIANGHTVNLTAAVTKTGSSTVTVNQGGVLNLNAVLTVPNSNTVNEMTVSGTLNISVANGLTRGGNNSNAVVTGTGIVDLTTTVASESVQTWDLQTGSTLKLSAFGNQTLDADFVGSAIDNLTLSGSGVKTLGENTTVSQILSIEGTATFNNGGRTLSFGAGATLRYLTTDVRTVGTEWPATFSGTGGIIIGNTSGSVAIGAAKVLGTSAPFTINSGSTFITNNFQLTLGNNFTNNGGTFTAGTGTVIFSGTNKTIGGTAPTSFYIASFSGSYTNNTTISVTSALSGGGSLTQGTTGILNIGGTAGITTLNATATGNTVNYNGGIQTLKGTTYNNLTLSGSGTKTNTGTTVSGIFSIEGTTTPSTASTWSGTNYSLQYKTTDVRTVGAEWTNTFAGLGGVLIANTAGSITLNAAKIFNASVPLTINSGATLITNNLQVTFGGDYINNGGTFTAGSSAIVITNAMATQSIAGFSTTGAVSMTKSAGIATLNGSISTSALNISGSGGTLNLGLGLTHTVSGNVSITGNTLQASNTTLNVSGNWSVSGGTFTPETSTVVLNNSTTATVSASTFNHLTINGTGAITATGSITVNGNFSLIAGTFVANNATSNTLTISGNYNQTGGVFDFNAGTSGTSLVNIAGNLSNTAGASSITTTGNNASNGTFTFNGSGVQNLYIPTSGAAEWTKFIIPIGKSVQMLSNLTLSSADGASQALYQGELLVNGTLNTDTYTISQASGIAGTALVTINSGGTLITSNATGISGSISSTNMTAIYSSGANYEFKGAATGTFTTTPTANTVNNLTINNGSGVSLGTNIAVNGTLTLTSGLFSLNNYNLSLSTASTIAGTPSSSNMIVTNGTGELRKFYNSNSAFSFPVGDNTATADYSPITVTMASGTFGSGAYIGVKVANAKHPNNPSSVYYLNRYWSISQSGITSYNASISATYLPSDISAGTASNQVSAAYNGTLPWTSYSALSGNTLSASNISNFGSYSGITASTTTLSTTTLSGFNYSVGAGPSAEQSFNVSGSDLSSNIIITPSTNFEISITSGSGFQSTPITLTQNAGVVATTPIYVRLKSGLGVAVISAESINISTSGSATKTVACSGQVLPVPTIISSVASISTFDYPVGFGPSNAISFTVSGSNLENNITVTAPTNFELSSSLPFSAVNVLVIPAVSGSVNAVPVYVRMKSGLPLGAVAAQNIDITSDNAATKNVACSGTVLTLPTLQLTPSAITTGFTYVYAASTTPIQSFTINGTNLVSGAPVVLTPSANFEISRANGANFTPEASISLLHTSTPTSLPDTTIYVRMRLGLGVGTQTGTIAVTSTSASQQTLSLSGTVSPAPTITTSTTLLSAFLYTTGAGPSQPQSFTVTGTNLTTNITVTPPTNYEIKLSTSGTYSSTAITVTQTGGNASATINVRLKSTLGIGTYGPLNIALTAAGAVGKAVSVTGNVVVNSPLISASKSTLTGFGYLSSEGGNTQGAQSFVVSGTSLAANITVAPPANYVISTSPSSGFQSTNLTITRSGTIVAPTTIYIKLATSLPAGNYGTLAIPVYVSLTSGTAAQVNINCIGKVFASPLITASGGGTFCQGESITLHSSGSDIVKRFWEGPNNFYASTADPVLTTNATPSLTGTYSVTGNVYVGGNLVTNGDFEAGNSSFGSGYVYVVPGKTTNTNGNLWPESTYTVDANPSVSHNNFSACTDHTTNSGKQMIINGSGTAGVVIWSQAVPVVPNASYEFSYWVQTVVATSPSKLQLYVNGIAAGPVYTADATTCTWKQFIYNTTAGSGVTSINLELINQNTVLNGNDFSLDDIVFQQILSATASTSVTVNPTMPVSVTIAASANPVYQNTPVTFTATPVNGGTTPAFQWKRKRSGVTTNVGTNSSIYTTADLITGDSVYCVLTSNIACPTGNPATSNKIGLTVNVRVNYWMGYTDTDWGKPENWTANFVPLTGDDVEYATVANFGTSAMRDLWLDIDRTIGSLINATTKRLVIPAGKGLTVNNTIYTDGNPDRIYIYSSTTGANGSLIYHNPINFPAAGTVEMYSKAWINPLGVVGQGTKFNWQYFGIPLRSLTAFPSMNGSYVRQWYETGTSISNHWIQLTNSSTLVPFYGYELCQTNAKTFIFKGLLENGNFSTGTLAVTYGKQGVPNALFPGQHVFANPFTAAIDIRQLTFGEGTLKTVYIYNTGTFEEWTNGGQTPTSVNNLTPGQYSSVPYNLAGTGSLPRQIPSMQAIVVKTLSSTSESSLATFGINYNSATLQKNTIAQRSKSENTVTTDKIYTMLEVTGKSFGDKMWLFTEPNCSKSFDNGWDAEKIISDSKLTPKLYAAETEGIYQVSTSDDINNTNLVFIPGKDITYTITVTNENVKKRYAGIYLHDIVENKVVDITETGTTYTFMADSTNTIKNRFKIATRYYEKDAPDAQTLVKVFNSGKSVFVENKSDKKGTVVLYDMSGRIIKRSALMPSGVTAISTNLVPGAYVAKAVCGTEEITKRLIVN